jgi:hypothetical protein
MITYFSRKKKLFAASLLGWMVFLNVAPGIALAYSQFQNPQNGQYYILLDAGEEIIINSASERVITKDGVSTGTTFPFNSNIYRQNNSVGYYDAASRYLPAQQVESNETNFSTTETGAVGEFSNSTELSPGTFGVDSTTGAQGIPPGEAGEAQLGTGDLAQNSVAALGTCSVGAILGRLLSALIGQLISTITGFLKTGISEVAMQVADCATRFLQICGFNPNQANQDARLVQKSVGGSSPAPSGLLGGLIPGDISFDSIMFCIINEIITYITLSTIQWINSGFDGNPVFIQNPGAFFQRIAAQEAGNFIYTAANGVQQAATAGVHQTLGTVANQGYMMTGAMRQGVTTGLVGYYNNYASMTGMSNNYTPPRPTLTDAQMMNPNFQNFGVQRELYNPNNYNPYTGAYGPVNFNYGPAMTAQMYRQQQISALQYQTSPYYNFNQCPPGQERLYDGSCRPNSLLTTVPGKQVESELNARNLTKYIRTATAQSFDAIITALVNQLMKVAINKMFEGEQKVNGAIQGATQNALR